MLEKKNTKEEIAKNEIAKMPRKMLFEGWVGKVWISPKMLL